MMGWKHAQGGAVAKSCGGPSGAWDGSAQSGMVENAKASGLAAGTLLATPQGWRPVEDLRVGDKVLTFDGGLQPVARIHKGLLWRGQGACPPALWPLKVPEGSLGNTQELQLLPEQNVLIESDAAEDIYGDPFALVPATALEGALGIERHPQTGPLAVFSLGFESDEIVYLNGSTLAFCPSRMDGSPVPLDEIDDGSVLQEYCVLTDLEARAVVRELMAGAADETAPAGNPYAA